MNLEELLQQYPLKRIHPEDGMAVTHEVWDEAHEYHRKSQNLQMVLARGSGIITGLEVIASDPPDTSMYILPGVAVDPAGQIILLPQPVSYDIGHEMAGRLHVLLSYSESRSKGQNGKKEGEDAPLYIHSEFTITAQTVLPNTPYVELARVNRSDRDAPFTNAQNPAQPGPNEIDLRFRREVGLPPQVSIAVSYLGQVKERKHGRGVGYLAQHLNHSDKYHTTFEDGVTLGPGIVTSTLVYLVGQGEFELDQGQINGLRNYVQRGKGTLLLESVDPPAEESFLNFLKAANMPLEEINFGHRLLTQPHLFAAPPAGFETQGTPKIMASEGVIFSTYNYGLLWQGERKGRLASRDEIRSAMEWGCNLVTYAIQRRRTGGKR